MELADLPEDFRSTCMITSVVHEGGEVGHGIRGLPGQPCLIGDREGFFQVNPRGIRVTKSPVDQAEHVEIVGLAALVANPLIDLEAREERQRLPEVVRGVCEAAEVSLEDVDWFVAHQANDRINQSVKESLGVPDEKVPSNIARYGNTSSATIPILVDELFRSGRMRAGQLVCLFALGAGLNWVAALMRL